MNIPANQHARLIPASARILELNKVGLLFKNDHKLPISAKSRGHDDPGWVSAKHRAWHAIFRLM
ncbi:MAG TPA: hypothetical protein VNW15_14595 [Rhizomicrobium sp.]|jgi:hypothetical protein|nr:hypothetical protein [Rhizomicrobium sp.]